MYTAQPLAGFNMLEQGSGVINIEGAVRLVKLMRKNLAGMQAELTTFIYFRHADAANEDRRSDIAGPGSYSQT